MDGHGPRSLLSTGEGMAGTQVYQGKAEEEAFETACVVIQDTSWYNMWLVCDLEEVVTTLRVSLTIRTASSVVLSGFQI